MKRFFLLFLLPFFGLNTSGQTFDGFNELLLNGSLNYSLRSGQSNSLTVPQSLSSKAQVSKEGNRLLVNGAVDSNEKIQITINDISLIQVNGSGDLYGEDSIRLDKIKIVLNGASDLHLTIHANETEILISGAGDCVLRGRTGRLKALVSGSGDLKAFDFIAQHADVSVSGAGDARINVSQALNATVSGAGSILFDGEPAAREISITGAGSIRQVGDHRTRVEEIVVNTEIKRDSLGTDTTRFTLGNKRIIIIEDGEEKDIEIDGEFHGDQPENNKSSKPEKPTLWKGFEIGMNSYTAELFKTFDPRYPIMDADYARSIQLNLNVLERSLRLYQNHVMLTTGLGFTFNRYMFNRDFSFIPRIDVLDTVQTGISYNKNMLKASYLTIPLFLVFNTNNKESKSFHLGFGVVGGLKLGSRTKQVWQDNGSKEKNVIRDDYNLNPFRYSLSMRVGYGNFNLFAEYGLSTLFRGNRGPELYPFSVGVSLIPF